MKTKKNLYLCAVLALVLLASLFGIGRSHYGTVNAEENTEGVFLKISSTNLSFDDNIYIYFRAYYDGIDISSDDYGMIFWKTEVAEAERTFENAQTLAASGSAIIIEKCDDWQNLPINAQGDKKDVATYKYKVAAKEMADVIYAEPYALKGGVYYYGKTIEYSVAAYASRRLGFYHGVAGSANENFINLLNAMVNYGTLAQKYFNYNVDNLMSEVVSAGKHATLTHIEALAPTCTEAGHAEYWKCECGQLFADSDGKTTLDAIPTLDPLGHDLVTDTCTHCTRCNYRKPSDWLYFDLNPDAQSYALISKGGASDTFIVVPSEYNSLPVTSIRTSVFQNNTQIIGIEIPQSINQIDAHAFDGCKNLNTVIIENNSVDIGDYAFHNCINLKSFVLGDYTPLATNQPNIGKRAFSSCYTLQEISIGKNVSSIGDYAFYGCSELSSVFIPDKLLNIGDGAFSTCSKLNNIIMGTNIKSIGANAFEGSNLERLTLPNNLESIGEKAFINCKKIISLKIPDSVLTIGRFAFAYCSFTDLILGDNLNTIGESAFLSCSLISNLNIPNNVIEIGKNAFSKCSNLEYVYIDTGLTNIPNSMFSECSLLKNVVIGNSVIYIGDNAFYKCTNLETISIPENTITIGQSAFADCLSIETITIGNNVVNIGENSFSNCSKLKTLTLGEKISQVGVNAFLSCKNISSINYKGSIESWCKISFKSEKSNPFYESSPTFLIDNKVITDITIPDTITTVKQYAFAHTKIQKVKLSNNLISIDQYAFKNCPIFSINIPNSVKTIGSYAFYGTDLNKIELGASIERIDKYAFGATHLYYIINKSSLPISLDSDEYGSIAYNAKIVCNADGSTIAANGYYIENNFVIQKCVYQYLATEYRYISYVGDEDIVTLERVDGRNYVIFQTKGIRNAVIDNSYTELNDYAFKYCTLKSISLPNTIKRLGKESLFGCSNLDKIYYDGTKDEWNSIGKNSYWNNGLKINCYIYCTDGILNAYGDIIS